MDARTGFFILFLSILGAVSVLMIFPLLQYVMAAALLAFVLYPAHRALSHSTVTVRCVTFSVTPRLSAAVFTGVAIVAAIVPLFFLSLILFRTVYSFVTDLDQSALLDRLQELAGDLGVDDELLAEIEEYLLAELQTLLDRGVEIVLQEILRLLNMSLQMGVGLLVLVFLLYYFLLDGRVLVVWMGEVAPIDDDIRERLFEEIRAVTWAVMQSHVLVAIVEGVLGGIGLYLLGVPNVAFWTVVMIVVSFLPAIGIWLVWGPAVGYLVVVGEPLNAGILLIYGIAVLSVVDNYLRAILVDRGAGVHPAIVLIGVIGGIYLFGIIGLFLGPVLLAVLKAGLNVFGDVYGDAGRESST